MAERQRGRPKARSVTTTVSMAGVVAAGIVALTCRVPRNSARRPWHHIREFVLDRLWHIELRNVQLGHLKLRNLQLRLVQLRLLQLGHRPARRLLQLAARDSGSSSAASAPVPPRPRARAAARPPPAAHDATARPDTRGAGTSGRRKRPAPRRPPRALTMPPAGGPSAPWSGWSSPTRAACPRPAACSKPTWPRRPGLQPVPRRRRDPRPAGAGRRQQVSPLLAEAIAVALRAAELTDGDVDPTVGAAMSALGYDRDFEQIEPHRAGRSPVTVGRCRAGARSGWRPHR